MVITALLCFAKNNGLITALSASAYEKLLFDTSKVHTIDIVMDDWEGFISECENEEYELCAVVIDGESYKNVGIRAKGNTSLSQVKNYGNDRYSFKIEFDKYDSTKTYHGLDKISLNNIIQDNTYMKDYLSYQMMLFCGAASPLCSYAYITVNGEDWGLYLAVEGVEEGFLERNFDSDYGELYKPDSTDACGGKGNGKDFDENKTADGENGTPPEMPDNENGNRDFTPPGSNGDNRGSPPEMPSDENGNSGFTPPDIGNAENGASQGTPPKKPDSESDNSDFTPPDIGNGGAGGFTPENNGADGAGVRTQSDISLIYTDDGPESYSNIFDNAKTDITEKDKTRLINALKNLGNNENIESTVDTDEVIKYFTVHNFVCNFDSYTGSMIHNYYLYEKDGKLSMIPWDYNLAFGGFGNSGDATTLVNYPIDTPVFGGTLQSRPMLNWIFESEEYTEKYHECFNEFITNYFDSGKFSETVESVKEMISPYVEKDPTKFCTYDEFLKGVDTLKEFCLLRAESVKAQLSGAIPSTADGQKEDNSSFIDASSVTISDMGTMNGAERNFGKKEPTENNGQKQNPDSEENPGNT